MNICIGQTKPFKGDIQLNLEVHKIFIEKAIEKKVDVIIFPELSLTGYEPALARELATTQSDTRLNIFQEISNTNRIIIGIGVPTKKAENIFISMVIFQPNKEPITYSKQFLFPSEIGIFTAGQGSTYIHLDDEHIIAPAICYELSHSEHSENAKVNNANFYIASVLNSVSGIDEDIKKLSGIAQKHRMMAFMANYVGQSGGYDCAGKSSIWDKEGNLIGQLDDKTEGLLIYDTELKLIIEEKIYCF